MYDGSKIERNMSRLVVTEEIPEFSSVCSRNYIKAADENRIEIWATAFITDLSVPNPKECVEQF
jgi:hypothetical protein